jgi:hypothetical protein
MLDRKKASLRFRTSSRGLISLDTHRPYASYVLCLVSLRLLGWKMSEEKENFPLYFISSLEGLDSFIVSIHPINISISPILSSNRRKSINPPSSSILIQNPINLLIIKNPPQKNVKTNLNPANLNHGKSQNENGQEGLPSNHREILPASHPGLSDQQKDRG